MMIECPSNLVGENGNRVLSYEVECNGHVIYFVYSPTLSADDLTTTLRRLDDEYADGGCYDGRRDVINYILVNLPPMIKENILAVLVEVYEPY